ncbi:hypothetical protein [Streptomyces macrosporus]|uniref:hypothetical protein n=1 Tax=Streptomyces macrosporus TaxID=44032 RepID=UPI0031CE53D4
MFRDGLRLRAITATDGRPSDAVLLDALTALAESAVSSTASDKPRQETSSYTRGAHLHLTRLAAEIGVPATAEKLLGTAQRLRTSWASTVTPPAVCALVAGLVQELADGIDDLVVADLAAGSGALLAALLLGGGKPRAVQAAESAEELRELLRLRLRCHRFTDPVIVPDAMGPEPPFTDADVVLADPPFHPSEKAESHDHPLRWAERIVDCLGPGGYGFAVMPEWSLYTTSRGGITPAVVRVRDALLRRRCLRAVIQLPRRVHPFLTGSELALLILTPGGGAPTITMCDADRIAVRHGAPGRAGWIAAWARETARLIGRARDRAAHPELCRDFRPDHLLDDRPLLPSLRLAPVAGAADHLDTTAISRQAAAVAFAPEPVSVAEWLSRLETAPRVTPVHHERLGNLIRSGQIRLLPGHRIPLGRLGTRGQRVYGREELTGERAVGDRRIDPLVLADYPAASVTEPGDVVVLPEDGLRAVVDEAGGSVLLFPVQGLRIRAYGELRGPNAQALGREARLRLRPHQLAAMISSRRNARRARGSLVRRVDLHSLEIPVLSPEETAELDHVMRDLALHTENLKRRLAAIERLGTDLAAGVADGALTLRVR